MTTKLLFLVLLLTEIFSTTRAQQRDGVISLGSSLSPNNKSYWVSNPGQFAFGFYKQGNGFAIGIWFENIKQKTVVWTANRDDPPLPHDIALLLSTDGRLILQDNEGFQTPISNFSGHASSASILDSGNFVLCDSNATVVWQSFDSPTDTILPDPRLLARKQLVSGDSETNHASGKFQLRMQKDGNLVQYPVGALIQPQYAYWSSGTFKLGDNTSLNLDQNGKIYLINSTGFEREIVASKKTRLPNKLAYRLTLDVDGFFRLYSHSLVQNQSWSVEWSSPINKCAPLGLCGVNAYCDPINDAPDPCQCLPGFHFVDGSHKSLGCKRNSSVDCTSEADGNALSVEELDGMCIEDNPYSTVKYTNLSACIEDCLRDCNCEAALYTNQQCNKQKLPLRFAKSKKGAVTTLVKVSHGRRTVGGGREDDDRIRTGIFITSIAVSGLAVLLLAAGGVLFYRYRVWKYRKVVSHQGIDGLFEDCFSVRPYAYDEL